MSVADCGLRGRNRTKVKLCKGIDTICSVYNRYCKVLVQWYHMREVGFSNLSTVLDWEKIRVMSFKREYSRTIAKING